MKKKILYCLSSLNHGGMEMVVLNYLNHMNLDLFQVDFLIFYGNRGYWDSYLREKGCKVTYFQSDARSLLARNREATQYFQENHYDIVHIHAMTSLKYRYAKIAKKAGVPCVIYHSHTSKATGIFRLLHALCKKRLDRWCDDKFACSHAAGQFMYRGEYSLIHNAIDLNKFSFSEQKRLELRKKHHCEDKFVIGNVSRLVESKNHLFLLRIAKVFVERKIYDFLFVICGDGSYRQEIETAIERENLSSYFLFLGQVSDSFHYYNMFDAIAFPSKYEGLSMVMVEAQANGCKIIGSDKMSDEVVLTDDIRLLPIDETEENYKNWAENLSEMRGKLRNDNAEVLKQKGYEIRTEAKKLEGIYLGV